MKKFKVEYKFRCDSDVVYHIETWQMEMSNDDYYFKHKANVEAMKILLSMSDELKVGNKELIDFQIIWEE